MTPTSKAFSLCSRIQHEFRRSVQELEQEGHDRSNIIQRIQERLTETGRQFGKNLLFFIAVVIACSQLANGEDVQIVTALFKLTLPKAYVVGLAAYFWANLTILFLQGSQYFFAKHSISNNFTEGSRFSAMKKHLSGDNDIDLVSPWRVGGFVRNLLGDSLAIGFVLLGMFGLISLPLTLGLIVIIGEAFSALSASTRWTIEWGIAVAAIGLFFTSISYLIIYFTPLMLRKDTEHLRWNFLYHVNKDENGFHQSRDRWL